ncbi:recombination protein F [Qipengyuania marisflavi]|uniref:Recombination protein F n=1 Tax=Qipengyuania marisflavi TaxID=2486356 RepID=A0A5S3PA35_9SPHN|nr:recombination protein F [Qipengyuania marisflavi]TMM50392.1 recombination protein F [Qipengyuania marisflavi]
MTTFENATNKAFAAVFAFAFSAICMAAAIVPASPAGLIA